MMILHPFHFNGKKWSKYNSSTPGVYYAKTAGVYTCMVSSMSGNTITKGITLTTKQCSISNSAANNERIISSTIQLKIAPNPFSNSTTISFTLRQSQKAMPADRQVSIQIFDMNGRLVKTLA